MTTALAVPTNQLEVVMNKKCGRCGLGTHNVSFKLEAYKDAVCYVCYIEDADTTELSIARIQACEAYDRARGKYDDPDIWGG